MDPVENPPEVVQEPVIQDQGNVAPGLDNELDDALSKAFTKQPDEPKPKQEPKQEPKVDPQEPKPAGKTPEGDKGKLPDPDAIDSTPPGKSSSSKEGWTTLRNNYKLAHKLAQEREEEISKLKKNLAERGTSTQKEVEELKKQIDDLSRYRAMVDIQADPEFVSKYDQPIEKAAGSIRAILKELKVDDHIISTMNFSDRVMMDKVVHHLAENVDRYTADKLDRRVREYLDLSDKRAETLEEHKSKFKEHLEAKKKESFTKTAEEEGRILKHREAIAETKDKDGNSMFPFLNKVVPKEGATQSEIDQANQHNRLADLLGQKLDGVLKMSSPEERVEVAVAAVASHYLTAQLKAANSQIESLKEELKKISNVTTETDSTKNTRPNGNRSKDLDLDSAMSEYFRR